MTAPVDILIQHLTSTGLSGGVQNMAVDGSVTPQEFWIWAPANERRIPLVKRLMIYIDVSAGITAEKFGDQTALTNGLLIQITDANDNVLVDLLDGDTIKTNAGIGELMFDVRPDAYGAGNSYIHARWKFHDFLEHGVHLPSRAKLKITVRDNLVGLQDFSCIAEGVWVK